VRLILAHILLALSLQANAAEWRFGTLTLEWLDGFTYQPQGNSQRFVGPNGEHVIVTVASLSRELEGAELERTLRQHHTFAEKQLPTLASAKGKVIAPLRESSVGESIELFSTGTNVSGVTSEYFYLQFLLISPRGNMALFTVEGPGDVSAQMARYRPLFDTAKWQ
jgi:hypothetical protein